MNSDHFDNLSPELRKQIEEECEPVEKTGKELKATLRDEDKITFFERRKEALKPQTKK